MNAIGVQVQQATGALESHAAEQAYTFQVALEIGRTFFANQASQELNALLEQATTLIAERFERVNQARVFVLNPTFSELILRASGGRRGLGLETSLPRDGDSAVARAVRLDQSLLTRRSATTAPSPDLLSEMQAAFTLPLKYGDKLLGALDLQSRALDAFTQAEQQIFELIAAQLSAAMALAGQFGDLRTRLREIETLGGRLVSQVWQDFALSRRDGSGLIASDQAPLSDLQRQAISRRERVEQHIDDLVRVAIPIRLRGAVIGALEWETLDELYGQSLHEIADDLAARLALTADNLRLLEQTQRQVERERLLNAISGKLMQQTDIEVILQTAVQELGQALRLSQTVVQLGEEEKSNDG